MSGHVDYNHVHPILGLSGPQEWQQGITSIDEVERFRPKAVAARHKKLKGEPRGGRDTERNSDHVSDFADAAENAVDAKEPES